MSLEPRCGFDDNIFTKKPPNDFFCGICLQVLNNPYQCQNGHCYCLCCIESSLLKLKTCPSCSVYLDVNTLSHNLLIQNIICELKVSCRCGWIGELHKIESHKVDDFKGKGKICSLFLGRNGRCSCDGKPLTHEETVEHRQTLKTLESFKVSATRLRESTICSTSKTKAVVSGETGENVVPHGIGSIRFADSSVYSGEWKDGQMSGLGALVSATGSLYLGSFANDFRHGNGVDVMGYLEYYGSFLNDQYDGEGRLWNTTDGYHFSGLFKCGLKHGPGSLIFDKARYSGIWREDKLDGLMQCAYPDGTYFTGRLHEEGISRLHGVLYSANQTVLYEGGWCNGMKHGMGTCKLEDGNIYKGQWKRDKRHGQGTISAPSGHMLYAGNWKAGTQAK
jgi:hypothetical protein